MKKVFVILFLCLGVLQYGFSQDAFVWICQGGSYTWYFDASPTSEVIVRAIKNYGFGPDATTYDTIHDNKITLTPQVYTVYDIISIDGESNTCNESLRIEVIDIIPTVSINNQNLSLSVASNLDYSASIFIHVTDYDNTLIYRYHSQTGDVINIDNISSGNYKIYITTEDSNCRVTIPITIP